MATFPDDARQNSLAADCRRCPDLVASRECIAWGNGPLDADVVVVGEAPAAGDPDAERWAGGNRTGMAYTSRHSGRRIRDLLADAGYGPEACYFTNAVKCFPAGEDAASGGVTNRSPTDGELANCRPYLREELETVDPRAVVATGRHATESVLALDGGEVDGFLAAVLEPIALDAADATLVPIVHPSYQDVWIRRLGYEPEGYRAAVADALDAA